MPRASGGGDRQARGGEGGLAPTRGTIEGARRAYAEELRATAAVRWQAVVEAFATVPRERFLGPGPWRIRSPSHPTRSSSIKNPQSVYRDALVVLDAARGINNGQPSLWAQLLDHLLVSAGESVLHLGCGTGYYSAILAELTGPQGTVTAVEIDDRLAAMARTALEPWPQARVVAADGAAYPPGPRDAIVASAGVS
ncbi:MAG: protein-L-isoaspartate O-methyltransferase family protein, partial [Acetobacteraceae bacterium]